MMALSLSHSPRAWRGVAGRKAQPDTNTEKGKRFQGGWIEENVGDESMGSSRIHLRGTWQDTSCSWRSWGCAGCRAPANEGSQAEEGEKRREQRGGRLEDAKHRQCHGFAKSWRDKAATWGLHMTKVTGWARIRIWILSQTLPFFRERK